VILPGGAVSELPPYTFGTLAARCRAWRQTPYILLGNKLIVGCAADAAAGLGPQQGRVSGTDGHMPAGPQRRRPAKTGSNAPKALKSKVFAIPPPVRQATTHDADISTNHPDLANLLGQARLRPAPALRHGSRRRHLPHRTFLRAIGPEPWRAAYVQPSRRPKDGRYGENPNRGQHYYQYQVVMKPAPENILDLYLGSLEALGLDLKQNDVRFVEDDWEIATLGAWGLGWEVWLNGMEVTQFTYFQQVGGLIASRCWARSPTASNAWPCTCRAWKTCTTWCGPPGRKRREESADLRRRVPPERSGAIDLQLRAPTPSCCSRSSNNHESEAKRLIEAQLTLPAYEQIMKASHSFNLLDARGAISVTERLHRPHPQPVARWRRPTTIRASAWASRCWARPRAPRAG
jgi:glycyl-tRNA synthetase alpha chain